MKILLAADGSDFTRRAARYLAEHVAWFAKPPEVHILHVIGHGDYDEQQQLQKKKCTILSGTPLH